MADSPDLSLLLEQSGWLRALARKLVADPHQADDLVQDTWVRALESTPNAELPVRGWVAAVLRNGAARHRRRDADREHRERVASHAEEAPSAHEVVERAALHRDVVQALLALEEPFRTAILLRFFEQRSYAEIAKQTGTTKATVNSRITRGIDRLRGRLDRAYGGDRRAWIIALVPLAGKPSVLELVGHGALEALAPSKGALPMYAAIGAATTAAVAITLTALSPTPGPAASTTTVRRSEPAETNGAATLSQPPAAEREVVADDTGAAPAAVSGPTSTSGERWESAVFHAMHLSPETTSLSVSSGAGDLEILPATDGMLRVEGKVSVDIARVRADELSTNFLDHVEIVETETELSLRDRHQNTNRGWSVSMIVYVPRALNAAVASGAGDVEISFAAGVVTASSGAGDVEINLKDQKAAITASSGAGDVEIEVAGLTGDLTATTGAGDVEVVAKNAQPSKYLLTSGAGDVELTLPKHVLGAFDLETGAGDIDLPEELGIEVQRIEGAGHRAKGSNGTGFDIKMRAGAGDIEIELAGDSDRGF